MIVLLVTEENIVAQSGAVKLNSDGGLPELLPCVQSPVDDELFGSKGPFFIATCLKTPSAGFGTGLALSAEDCMEDRLMDGPAHCCFPAVPRMATVHSESHVL